MFNTHTHTYYYMFCRADTTDSLKDYFDESRKHAENNDKDFYVLCIQCFEVCTLYVHDYH